MDEELNSIQLDKPKWGKNDQQLAKHTVDSQFETKPVERSLHLLRKGDDVQKLSVIQALPQLLQYDPNGTLTRILPKIQQELPKSSCEFHIATSKIFRLLIERQLPLNLINAVLQGSDSKDPVVSNAWMETLLAVIPVIPVDQIKANVLPLALAKAQPSSPVYCRVSSAKLLGQIATHPNMTAVDVKTNILPTVQSLCQDCFQDVRASMCAQLHLVAQGLGDTVVKSNLLPSLVELSSDDNMAVRAAAVTAVALMTPQLNKETKTKTIVPLIKQLCQRTADSGDTTFPTVAKEFGKILDSLRSDLDPNDSLWFLQFYKQLASKGKGQGPMVGKNREVVDVTQVVICREQCAFNLPAVTLFVMHVIPSYIELWHSVFSDLANDSCYLVRKTAAGCLHEVVKILGPQCKIIKTDIVKILRDDAEEVLQMLVPNIGTMLELFSVNGVLSRDSAAQSTLEIARSLLKCQMELAKGYDWRIKADLLQQMEHLPNCMPSDFIHQHFSPAILNCVLESRPRPVRSQACKTLLVFLRYNLKEIQRKWIRDNLINNLCNSQSCYTRQIFILMCQHAMQVFSSAYFKKHFFEPLLSLADDKISNIRLCVAQLLPNLFKMLHLPEDRKLQTLLDSVISKYENLETDKDVKHIFTVKMKEAKNSNKQDNIMEERRKQEEENKIYQGKPLGPNPTASIISTSSVHSGAASREGAGTPMNRSATIMRSTSAPPRTASRTSSGSNPSDMSFLEQHFYIDAGINLPRDKITVGLDQNVNALDISKICEQVEEKLTLITNTDSENNCELSPPIATVSVENTNVETMTESDLKKLETSTTNITDDVKVNLRKRTKKGPKNSSNSKFKRYSSVFPTTSLDTSVNHTRTASSSNRRSLHFSNNPDLSKIPVCLKKSKSNADVKKETKIYQHEIPSESLRLQKDANKDKDNQNFKPKAKTRPKSEILTHSNGKERATRPISGIHNSRNSTDDKSNVPIKHSIIEGTSKTSNLPVLKRRAPSDQRKLN